MKQKIVVTFILTLFLLGITFLSFNYETKEKEKTENNLLSIMLETKDGKYVRSQDKMWPTKGYTFNSTKSYCEDQGKLSYNEEAKKVSLITKGSEKCYVYFDIEIIGSEDSPYKINTIEDLVDLSNKVNTGETYQDKYFILTKDLDFKNREDYANPDRIDYGDINGVNGVETLYNELNNDDGKGFIPIGSSETTPFKGNLNGNDNEISNLFINSKDYKTVGLFGYTYDASIKNLTIEGGVYNLIAEDSGIHTGAFIGLARGNTVLENLTNFASVQRYNGNGYTGGFVGTGTENIIIKNCHNKAIILGTNVGAGIVGNISGDVYIENSDNYNTIRTNTVAGGIIAFIQRNPTKTVTINKCFNQGIIDLYDSVTLNGNIGLGGLVGQSNTTINILNSYNISTIGRASSGHSAGLLGVAASNEPTNAVRIINSYNAGDIIGDGLAAGIMGYYSTAKIYLNNIYNYGNCTSANPAYSIAYFYHGVVDQPDFKNIYYENSIAAGNIDLGGIGMTKAEFGNDEFYQTLNNNIESISLEEVDGSLKDYTLNPWYKSSDGYPFIINF